MNKLQSIKLIEFTKNEFGNSYHIKNIIINMILQIQQYSMNVFNLILDYLDDKSYINLMSICKILFHIRNTKLLTGYYPEYALQTGYKISKLFIGSEISNNDFVYGITYTAYTFFGSIYDMYANKIVDDVPSYITHLKAGFYFNRSLDHLSKHITHLTLGRDFNQEIINLPESLTYLKLGARFNKPVDYLPENLKYLIIDGCDFNQSVDNLPVNLKSLTIRSSNFNKSVDNLPKKLKELRLFPDLCYNLQIINLSANLKYLNVSTTPSRLIINLPKKLKHLRIYYHGHTSIILPDSIEYLCFWNSFFDESIEFFKLPKNLKQLKIASHYCKKFKELYPHLNIIPLDCL